jgi:hypothetical protein
MTVLQNPVRKIAEEKKKDTVTKENACVKTGILVLHVVTKPVLIPVLITVSVSKVNANAK